MTKPAIEAKKQRALERDLLIKDPTETEYRVKRELRKLLKSGKNITRDNAEFVSIKEPEEKHFLRMPQNQYPLESVFGTEMLRILSDGSCEEKPHISGKYAAKRTRLAVNDSKEIESVIKWDSQLEQKSVLRSSFHREEHRSGIKNIFEDSVKDDEKFLRGFARLAGVLAVLGEHDFNATNILKSNKTKLPVKIDVSVLLNNQAEGAKSFGSAFTNAFLRIFLGGEKVCYPISDIAACGIHSLAILDDESDENWNEVFNHSYKIGIDSVLLENLKNNLAKPENDHLKKYFIEMMEGVQDAINLAYDDKFFDEYAKNYEKFGGDWLKSFKNMRAIYLENAKKAEQQFAPFLQYCQELLSEGKHSQPEAAMLAAKIEQIEADIDFLKLAKEKQSAIVLTLKDSEKILKEQIAKLKQDAIKDIKEIEESIMAKQQEYNMVYHSTPNYFETKEEDDAAATLIEEKLKELNALEEKIQLIKADYNYRLSNAKENLVPKARELRPVADYFLKEIEERLNQTQKLYEATKLDEEKLEQKVNPSISPKTPKLVEEQSLDKTLSL